MVSVFKIVGERSTSRYHRPFSLLSVVSNRIVNHPEKYGLLMFFSTVFGLLDELQIFCQLCLIKLLGHLTGLGLLKL